MQNNAPDNIALYPDEAADASEKKLRDLVILGHRGIGFYCCEFPRAGEANMSNCPTAEDFEQDYSIAETTHTPYMKQKTQPSRVQRALLTQTLDQPPLITCRSQHQFGLQRVNSLKWPLAEALPATCPHQQFVQTSAERGPRKCRA